MNRHEGKQTGMSKLISEKLAQEVRDAFQALQPHLLQHVLIERPERGLVDAIVKEPRLCRACERTRRQRSGCACARNVGIS